jgi:hypothetical protein
MHDIQSDLSRGLPPKKESNKPFISNFIINQQTTTIDIIGLLEKAVESESGRDSLIGLNFMIWKSQEFLQAPNMID